MQTGQTTAYHAGDGGDHETGLPPAYYVLTIGAYALTSNIEVAHYAAATISFAAPNQINDAANGLATILTGDTVVVKGSTGNDGVYTVAGGGVAAGFTTVEAIVNEGAGAYMSLYKQAAHSNNCVFDRRSGRYWSRYTSNAEKVGTLSDGTLNWYNVAMVFPLHGAGADLQMIAPATLRIVGGAGEVLRYHVGDLIDCAGFANAANNLPGYYVMSVTVNGADLDIVVDPVRNVLVNEAAAGARTIGLVTRSTFNYAAGANLIGLAGYTDWRNPNSFELMCIADEEAPTGFPDAAAFPGWPGGVYSSTTVPPLTTQAHYFSAADGRLLTSGKSLTQLCALVRP